MVEIIRHGLKHLGVVGFECSKCGCIFKTDNYAVKPARDKSEYDTLITECPECSNGIWKAWI